MTVNALRTPQIEPVHTLVATAPAKINLTLDILGRREDGFHELRSLAIGVGLTDRIRCRATPDPGVRVDCSDASLASKDNLAAQAVQRLAKREGINAAIRIEIEKRIPVAAGLGGGSSDAATTLRLCDQLWNTRLDAAALAEVGSKIGSDVALFFHLPAAVMTGRGERVEPVSMCWQGWVVLVMPDVRVATADVYRTWAPQRMGAHRSGMDEAIRACRWAREITELASNQLESAAFQLCPALASLQQQVNHLTDRTFRVSGSGSTMFTLYDDQEEAAAAARTIEERCPQVKTTVAAAPFRETPIVSEEG